MNREPKYRAFDKETKKVYPVLSLSFDFKLCDLYDGPIESLSREWKDVELLQFTGLHDKNGKEIYEGDIVSCVGGYEEGERECSAVVEWNEDVAQFWVKCANGHKNEVFPLADYDLSEVIGNIPKQPLPSRGKKAKKK